MPDTPKSSAGLVQLSELALGLAQQFAERYGVTVPQAIEAVLVEWTEWHTAASPPRRQNRRQPARVIKLRDARGPRPPAR